jgi:hypothetical protein
VAPRGGHSRRPDGVHRFPCRQVPAWSERRVRQARRRADASAHTGRQVREERHRRCHAVSVFVYFPLAVGVVAGGSVIAGIVSSDMFVLGYVIYGLIAIFLVIIPNALAFWFAAEVPFPTLYRTVANLERRWRPAAMVIVAGLVVLMFHLVFFPWPDIFFRA